MAVNKSAALALAILVTLITNNNFVVISAVNKTAKVLILGAGLTGVSFAKILNDNNQGDFLILEGRDYIGGRMKDANLNGTIIQEGAGWIHEVDDKNPIWKLKQKYGLRTAEENYTNFIVRNETGFKDSNADIVYTKLKKAVRKTDALIEKRTKLKLWDLPMKSSLAINGWYPRSPTEIVMDYYANDFENGVPPEISSLNNGGFTLGYYEDGKDELVTDRRGFKYIVERLAADFKDKIHLNTTVTKIHYSNKSVTVKTANGLTYTGDYAFITFSTGVLLSGTVKFIPPLPKWKMEAAELLPMCQYTKIFLKFPRRFWDSNNFVLVASENRGYYVHWQNFGRYVNESILIGTVTGFESIRVEKLTDKQVIDEAMTVLKKVYGSSIPQPSGMKMSRWSRDPFSFGAYSSPVIGADSYAYIHLKTPVGKTLWFGGEAATDVEDYGYAQGAFKSGIDRAKVFLKCLKQNDCPKYKPRKAETCQKPDSGVGGNEYQFCNLFLLIWFAVYMLTV